MLDRFSQSARELASSAAKRATDLASSAEEVGGNIASHAKSAVTKLQFSPSDITDITKRGIDALKDRLPILQALFAEQYDKVAKDVIYNDETFSNVAKEVREILPLPVRIIVSEKKFVDFCLGCRDFLIPSDVKQNKELLDTQLPNSTPDVSQ